MSALAVVSAVLAVAWLVPAGVAARSADAGVRARLAPQFLGLAAVHAAAAAWPPLAPLVPAAWFAQAMALPDGRWTSRWRRVAAAGAGIGAVVWSGWLAVPGSAPGIAAYLTAAALLAPIALLAVPARCRRADRDERRTLQWLVAAAACAAGFDVIALTLHVMVGSPAAVLVWLAVSLIVVPLGHLVALLTSSDRWAAAALVQSVAAAGVAGLVSAVYLVVVAGINGTPTGPERGVLLASLTAAVVVAVLSLPVRGRLIGWADALLGDRAASVDEVVTTFGARMSRAVPMDEVLLQVAESLRGTIADGGVEVWTGTAGSLTRAVSLPDRGPARWQLGTRERVVVGQARIGGPAWAAVWLPAALDPPARDLRVVPIAHLGELLGLVLVRRDAEGPGFTDRDDGPLVELARQLGLALHNVRLDSALQDSLAALAERNDELQASRLRIVASADSSRRAIERNLHDGAQQHLVALAVKVGLARQVAEDGDLETVSVLLAQLRGDVQATIMELRELAHGIYPPLLRDRGLGEALRTAANRSPLPCTVEVTLPGRFPEAVETAAYFCCLEALQNAGKHAGEGATVSARGRSDASRLCLEVTDDGAGFDDSLAAVGHGFVNMRDRLGALGGELAVASTPGAGTTLRLAIPARPLAVPAAVPGAPVAQAV